MSDEQPDAATDDQPDTAANDRPDSQSGEWKRVGRDALAALLRRHQYEVERDVSEAISGIEYAGSVDGVYVLHLRDAIEALQVTVEERLAPLASGKEPWERTAGRVPQGRTHDGLGLDEDHAAELRTMRGEAGAEGAVEVEE